MDERRSQKPYDIERGVEVWTHTATPLLVSHEALARRSNPPPEALSVGNRSLNRLRFFLL